ncbi:uncharacterized protein [Antedon mediterranea]
MGDVDTRSFNSDYVMPTTHQHEQPKYRYKKPYKNRRKQVALASILFVLFFLAVVATCILFIYFLVNEDKTNATKMPPLVEGISVDGQLSLGQSFLIEYNDPNSDEYQQLEIDFIEAMDEVMLTSNYSSTYAGTTVIEFRNGSTVVLFNLNFNDIPPHLDENAGSEELGNNIEKDITEVINDAVADSNSTLNAELNAKEDSTSINDVRVDIQPVTSKPTSSRPLSTKAVILTTTEDDATSKIITTNIPQTTRTTTTRPATSKMSTFGSTKEEATTNPPLTTVADELVTTEVLTTVYDETTIEVTTKGSTTKDTLTTESEVTTLEDFTTEVNEQTTVHDSTTLLATTLYEATTVVTTMQTTEESASLQHTTDKSTTLEETTEVLTTLKQTTDEPTTEQLTTEQETTRKMFTTVGITTEQLTTILTTEEFTELYSSTDQGQSVPNSLTEFPANSSAPIHVFGSMVINSTYPESLNNKTSQDYNDLVRAVRIGIDCAVLLGELEPVYAGNDITELKSGSIIVLFTIYITSAPSAYYNSTNELSLSEYISGQVVYSVRNGIEIGLFGNLDILKDSVTVIDVTNSAEEVFTCLNITSDCCRNLPYYSAVFPNDLAKSQAEAEEILSVFGGSCNSDAALYLCSKVYPDCPTDSTPQMLPCKSFCEDVTTSDDSGILLAVEANITSQITNCTVLGEASLVKPCFTSEGQVINRPPSVYNEDICSTRPLHQPASARIVGGQAATEGEWPWMISLQRFTSHKCGAVLIAPQYVVTAAHCLGLFNTAVLGTTTISSATTAGEQRIGIKESYAHPEYNPLILENDIAILKLERQVEYTDYVRPACVSTNATQFQAGQFCYISGWGDLTGNGKLPDVLQEVSLPLVDLNTCATRFASIGISIDERVVCAGFPEGGKDACQGDSGGPLVCQNPNGVWNVYGIVSNGVECALPNSPGIYTRVPTYIDFINLVLGGGTPQYRICTDEEFGCSNGPCINKDWQCDGHNDCRDNSDELMCGCSDDEFTCGMGDCVYDGWLCDGDYDCLDGSDEQNCDCLSNQFDCGDGICIVSSYFCDGTPDCRNGADEDNCQNGFTDGPRVCGVDKFTCGSGHCIEAAYECDEDLDCEDGSDEQNCPEVTVPPVLPARCYNVTSQICDGFLPSNMVLFPNTYASTPEDAEALIAEFNAEADCHQDSMRLICPLVYQECEDDLSTFLSPCESLCQDVTATCAEEFGAVTQNNGLFEISCLALTDENCLGAPGYCGGFLCDNNQHCIQDDYKCDGLVDCSDDSDESAATCDDTGSFLCHHINNTFCSSYLPYDYAAFPNSFAQTVEIADQAIRQLTQHWDCHEDLMLLMCNLVFPECDGYGYKPCIDHCIDVAVSCPAAFSTLRNELNYTTPVTCDDFPTVECLAPDGKCYEDDYYQCGDGKCILFEYTCDSHSDCLDNSDESNCSCTDLQYICSDTGACLGSYQVCDGIENCLNAEDELSCDDGCPGDFFRCANETTCIPLSYVCDNIDDCTYFNDEQDCSVGLCGTYEFQCKSDNYCIPNYNVCDNYDDCTDGSDEMECGKRR